MPAKQSAQQSSNKSFYADGDILFCRACSKAVDHNRQSVLKLYCQSQSHKEKMSKKISPKQKTLTTTMFAPKMPQSKILSLERISSDGWRPIKSPSMLRIPKLQNISPKPIFVRGEQFRSRRHCFITLKAALK